MNVALNTYNGFLSQAQTQTQGGKRMNKKRMNKNKKK